MPVKRHRAIHEKLLISATSQPAPPERGSDTDHPCIKRSARCADSSAIHVTWSVSDAAVLTIPRLGRYQVGAGVRAVPGLGGRRACVARVQAGVYISNQFTSRVR